MIVQVWLREQGGDNCHGSDACMRPEAIDDEDNDDNVMIRPNDVSRLSYI